MRPARRAAVILVLAPLGLLPPAGCASRGPSAAERTAQARFDSDVEGFATIARDLVDAATLAELPTKPQAVVAARLAARRRLLDRLDQAAAQKNRAAAILDLWWNFEMLRASAADGEVKAIFGSDAPLIERTAGDLCDRIEQILADYIEPNDLAEVRGKVLWAAKGKEIITTTIDSAALGPTTATGEREGGNPLLEAISLPFSPFTAAKSVETGVADIVDQAESFNAQFRRLPEQTRLQAEKLLESFYLSPLAKSTTQTLQEIGTASRSLSETAAALPSALREQAETLLSNAEETQSSARQTLAGVRETLDSVTGTLAATRTTTTAIDSSLDRATTTAAAWEETANAVQRILDSVERIQGPPPPPDAPPSPPSFTFDKLDGSAERIEAVATRISQVLAQVQQLVDDPTLSAVEAAAGRSVEQTSLAASDLVDRIFWRSLVVVGVAGASLVAYGLIRARRT